MSRKVLVVDDEKLIVKGIRFSLEQDGMEVDCAYDGEEAVEKAKDKKYDMELSKLETEREALKTEYDSVKKVISDNIERTFGIFS